MPLGQSDHLYIALEAAEGKTSQAIIIYVLMKFWKHWTALTGDFV